MGKLYNVNAAAKNLGQVAFIEDARPYLALPGLIGMWWAEDLQTIDSKAFLRDRNALQPPVSRTQASLTTAASPTRQTFADRDYIVYDGVDDRMQGDLTNQPLNNFSVLFVVRPSAGALATGTLGIARSVADSEGVAFFAFADGAFRAQVQPNEQATLAGCFVAETPVIVAASWNGTRWILSKNGVKGTPYVPATPGPATPAVDALAYTGAGPTGVYLKGGIARRFDFSVDIHDAAYAPFFDWHIAELKERYSIA